MFWLLASWLDTHQWYRRWRGGIWYYVHARVCQGFWYWRRDKPLAPPFQPAWAVETILRTEDYTRLKPPIGAKL